MTRNEILSLMQERILILDGATGTYLQALGLGEADYASGPFAHHSQPLLGCNDALCVSRPQVIESMHRAYIDAGADIISTNSFNSNAFSLADYGLEQHVHLISHAAAQCARRAADGAGRPVIVAGSMGPTNRTASMSTDVANPASRNVTFGQLYDTFRLQAQGLVEGGADVLLLETSFDTLNTKAAIKAINDLAEELGRDLPIMVSATLGDASGRTLSGQTVEAFVASVQHGNLLSLGLNCGFGAKQLLPWLRRLEAVAPCAVSVHPNAGLPNVMGGYDETPETFAAAAREFLAGGTPVNIFGGCCGTTPDHIAALAQVARQFAPRPLQQAAPRKTLLSGLEPLVVDANTGFVNIGERTNVAGSAKFKRLVKEKQWAEAVAIARHQVVNGAQVVDVCMDDGLIDGVEAMTTFLRLMAGEPDIARVPVMIDSSNWDVLKAGLENVQGKSIVNSISLKEGEQAFLDKARYIHSMGAAALVMLFDEQGQADTHERKVQVARRVVALLQGIGYPLEDVFIDPNVLAVATGMPEHDDSTRAFIEAVRTIRAELPQVHVSGGVSNLSFAFRGNNDIRQAMHSVFLYHAKRAGLELALVNPAMATIYSEIPADMLRAVEDVILHRDAGAGERLIAFAQAYKAAKEAQGDAPQQAQADNWRDAPLDQRIAQAMVKGDPAHIEADTLEALEATGSALGVIDSYLMPAMEHVGRLFGEGQMFLPQVVKSARVMKQAVAVIEPYMQAQGAGADTAGQATVVMATVKGDVHDIGKNIVSVVTQCNGYNVVDLGVMADTQTIVDAAVQHNAAVIGLSGLITPSLTEMVNTLRELERRHLSIPVIVGGATTSPLHTAVKMAPEYPGGLVIHARAAADNPAIIRRLLSDERDAYVAELKSQQRIIRDNYARERAAKAPLLTLEQAQARRHVKRPDQVAVPSPQALKPIHTDNRSLLHPTSGCLCCDPLVPLVSWPMFLAAWGLKGHYPEILDDPDKGAEARQLLADAQELLGRVIRLKLLRLQVWCQILPANSVGDDIVITAASGKQYVLPMERSLRDEPETHCLADHLLQRGQGQDWVAPFVVSAGVGVNELQEHYRSQGDEYHAIMIKLLADRLAEALAVKLSADLQHTLHWGTSNIRMAFGYSSCPSHELKRPVMEMLGITPDNSGLSLTSSAMINPGESICGLVFANTPTNYFNVK